MSEAWPAATFPIATNLGVRMKAGYARKGLGLHRTAHASLKVRSPARWTLTHLGSGLRFAVLKGSVDKVFPIASEIADAGDWTFDGPLGWKNQFPDAAERLWEIIAKYPERVEKAWGSMHPDTESLAREVMAVREVLA